MIEDTLGWYGHVNRRPIDVTIRIINYLEIISSFRGRGRYRKTWLKTIKSDMKTRNLMNKIVLNMIK